MNDDIVKHWHDLSPMAPPFVLPRTPDENPSFIEHRRDLRTPFDFVSMLCLVFAAGPVALTVMWVALGLFTTSWAPDWLWRWWLAMAGLLVIAGVARAYGSRKRNGMRVLRFEGAKVVLVQLEASGAMRLEVPHAECVLELHRVHVKNSRVPDWRGVAATVCAGDARIMLMCVRNAATLRRELRSGPAWLGGLKRRRGKPETVWGHGERRIGTWPREWPRPAPV